MNIDFENIGFDKRVENLFSQFDFGISIMGCESYLKGIWGTECEVIRTMEPIRSQIIESLKTSLPSNHD